MKKTVKMMIEAVKIRRLFYIPPLLLILLRKAHVHLFVMGMIVFLIVALFAENRELKKYKTFCIFLWLYNIGLPITAVMMVIRGITQVLNISLSKAVNASISGIAGIGHILTGVGIILLLISLKKAAGNGR